MQAKANQFLGRDFVHRCSDNKANKPLRAGSPLHTANNKKLTRLVRGTTNNYIRIAASNQSFGRFTDGAWQDALRLHGGCQGGPCTGELKFLLYQQHNAKAGVNVAALLLFGTHVCPFQVPVCITAESVGDYVQQRHAHGKRSPSPTCII